MKLASELSKVCNNTFCCDCPFSYNSKEVSAKTCVLTDYHICDWESTISYMNSLKVKQVAEALGLSEKQAEILLSRDCEEKGNE